MVFLYSGIFSAEKDNHPVPSFYELMTGEKTASSGLSRSFSEIVRFRFNSAREYNQNGIPVFIFFLVQLVQRIGLSLVAKHNIFSIKKMLIADIIISTGLFIFCFRGLILAYWNQIIF